MRLYVVTIRIFDEHNSMTTSVILALYEHVRHKKVHAASNLEWLNQVIRPDLKFEVVSVVPFNPEQHGAKVQ